MVVIILPTGKLARSSQERPSRSRDCSFASHVKMPCCFSSIETKVVSGFGRRNLGGSTLKRLRPIGIRPLREGVFVGSGAFARYHLLILSHISSEMSGASGK